MLPPPSSGFSRHADDRCGRLCRIDSISKRSSSGSGCATVFVVALLSIFVIAGTAIGYFMSFRPLSLAYQARSWTTADCEVISSRIVHNDDTSRPDIRYRYSVADRPYVSDRYNFIPGSTNDSTVAATVAHYAPGTRFECYV